MLEKKENTGNASYRKPKRKFEKSGVVNPKKAYYVPLDNVVNTDNEDIKTMVDDGRYFTIFAPRQSGKTTFFKRMCDQLHKDPTYVAVILDFQNYEALNIEQFYAEVQENLYSQLLDRLYAVGCQKAQKVEQFLDDHRLMDHISLGALFKKLNRIIEFKKIVIFIDEFDGIPQAELGNFLTTLRSLYQQYKEVEKKALYSSGLVGIRNITKLIVGGVSPFNIADEVGLPAFSLKNITDLYGQYTEETNQPFTESAVKKVFEETGGQPWLVNRLGTILTVNIKPETVEPIDDGDVDKALEILLNEKNNHFDNLYEKALLYKETFVEIVFNPAKYKPYDKDQSWLEQYGLIKKKNFQAVTANNIYKKMFVNLFFEEVKAVAAISPQTYITADGGLDMVQILLDFDRYIAQIGVRAFYQNKKPYEKTGQFLLTAWLYPFVKDGAGDLRYEPPTGLGRMDILLNHKGRRYIIETKVNHQDTYSTILRQGVKQVAEKYLATESAAEGYVVIFDTGTHAGAVTKSKVHTLDGQRVISVIIGIGYRDLPEAGLKK